MNENLHRKLISTERFIEVYEKNNEYPVQSINVNNLALEEILKIVPPPKDDPMLYDGYILKLFQIEQFNKHLNDKIMADLDRFSYILVADGKYLW